MNESYKYAGTVYVSLISETGFVRPKFGLFWHLSMVKTWLHFDSRPNVLKRAKGYAFYWTILCSSTFRFLPVDSSTVDPKFRWMSNPPWNDNGIGFWLNKFESPMSVSFLVRAEIAQQQGKFGLSWWSNPEFGV